MPYIVGSIACVVAAIMLGPSLANGALSAPEFTLYVSGTTMAVACAAGFFYAIAVGERVEVVSHWGGIGGGLGGWRFSRPLVLLLTVIGLVFIMAMMVHRHIERLSHKGPDYRERYSSAVNLLRRRNVSFGDPVLKNGSLYVRVKVPTQQVVDEFWQQARLCDINLDGLDAQLEVTK